MICRNYFYNVTFVKKTKECKNIKTRNKFKKIKDKVKTPTRKEFFIFSFQNLILKKLQYNLEH